MGSVATIWRNYCSSVSLVWNIDREKRIERVARYISRGVANPLGTARWMRALFHVPALREFSHHDPRLLLKPTRHYISRAFTAKSRIEALIDHYTFLARAFSPEAVSVLAQGGSIILANLVGKHGTEYQLALRKTRKFDREGDLILSFQESTGQGVYCFVFSFLGHPSQAALHIGCMQGPTGTEGLDLIRKATKELHGIRPKNILIEAIHAAAQVLGITRLHGISNDFRVYQSDRTYADYDAFWQEVGGVRQGADGFFSLPSALRHHDLSEVPSHRRAEYRRRMAIRESVADQLGASLAAIRGNWA